MIGPGLKVALWHLLIRGKGQLFAKIREKQLQALKVWGKNIKKVKRNKWDSNLHLLECETTLETTWPRCQILKQVLFLD